MINSISVVLTFFNEEKRIKKSLKEIDSFIKKNKKINIEIIFVNDGSYDKSSKILKEFIKLKKKTRIKLIEYKKNLGKGRALKTGIFKANINGYLLLT